MNQRKSRYNFSESYDAMASVVDVLLCKICNRWPKFIYKTIDNLQNQGAFSLDDRFQLEAMAYCSLWTSKILIHNQ